MNVSFNRVRVMWAKKLLRARFFVVLTDKESAIAFNGVDPRSFTDSIALAAQKAELEDFHQDIGILIKEHEACLKSLTNEKPKKKPVSRKKSSSRSKDGKSR